MLQLLIVASVVIESLTAKPNRILLALQAPITGIGQPYPDFRQWNASFQYTVSEINSRSDILPDTRIEAIAHNTKCQELEAVAPCMEISGMIPGKPRAVILIGDVCSDVSKMSASMLPAFSIPQISFGSSSPLLSDKSDYPFFTRVAPSDKFLAQATAQYLYETLGFRRVALIATKDSKSQEGINAFYNEFSVVRNGTILNSQLFGERDQANDRALEAQIRAIKDSGARVIVSYGKPDAMHQLYKSFISEGLSGVPYVHVTLEMNRFDEYLVADASNPQTCGVLCDVDKAKKGLEGLLGFDKLNLPLTQQDKVIYDEWAAKYKKNGLDPLQVYQTYEYDAIMTAASVLHKMIEAGQDVNDGKQVLREIYNFKHPGFTGTGAISFDSNGDRPPQFLINNFQTGADKSSVVGYLVPDKTKEGRFSSTLSQPIIWAGQRTELPPDTAPTCATDYIPSGWSECQFIGSTNSSNGEDENQTWVSVGVAALGLFLVMGVVFYFRKKSGSLLRALEIAMQGALPTILSLTMELSDLASDVACAVSMIFLPNIDGLDDGLRTAYVACVAALIIPSVYNLQARYKVFRTELIDSGSQENAMGSVQNKYSVKAEGSVIRVQSTGSKIRPEPNDASSVVASSVQVVPGTANLSQQILMKEKAYVSSMLQKRQTRHQAMMALILGVIFEDCVMSILNCYLVWHGKDYNELRKHRVFGLFAMAAVSSLVSLGIKGNSIYKWITVDRPMTRKMQMRASRLDLIEWEHVVLESQAVVKVIRALISYDIADKDQEELPKRNSEKSQHNEQNESMA
eukprot:TRINITY_DN5669_c0_g1_i1.p1 TRINITY_DN5669_c0_g1~~TRINITY_DN5669_c0_g1_i1.p1  ORF type:complete len:799 (+),score=116.18 TRINITY_DN5669_c0_g1_i1:47-2443(+)